MIEQTVVDEFLGLHRLAVVGASSDERNFGTTIYKELRAHGYAVVPVHPTAATVSGDVCYPDLASVQGEVDGVVVMVHRDKAADVIRDCVALGVKHVWLFKGLGSPGAVSADALALCRQHGISVVEGACPLMFLEPVGFAHRVHRGIRRMNGSLARVA